MKFVSLFCLSFFVVQLCCAQTAIDLPGIADLEVPVRVKDLLKSIVIEDGFEQQASETVALQTHATIGWTELPATIALKKTAVKIDTTVLIEFPEDWKISSLLPALNRLDMLRCDDMHILVSSYDYFDEKRDLAVKKGANLFGNLSFGGPLQYAKLLIGSYLSSIKISGLIKPGIIGSSFTAKIPGSVEFVGGFTAKDLELAIVIGDDAVTPSKELCVVQAQVSFMWPSQENLIFNTMIGVYSDKLSLYGSMEGKIKNIFGINGIHSGNWFFGGTVDSSEAGIFSEFIPLSSFSMGFDLTFAGINVKMASKIGISGFSGLGDLAFEGKLEDVVSLNDCIEYVGTIIDETSYISEGMKEFENKIEGVVPNFVLNDVHLFFSPKDVAMGGVIYSKGLLIDGSAEILGSNAEIIVDIQEAGIKVLGYLEEMEFGPIKITGPGYDRIMDTSDDGMIMDAVLTLEQQYCYISGKVVVDILGGVSSEADIDIAASGISFSTEQKLLNLFDFGLFFTAELNDYLVPVDFYVKGHMRQTALTELQNLLSKTARRMAKTKMLLQEEQVKKGVCDFVVSIYDGFWNTLASLVGNTFNITEFTFESDVDQLIGQTILPSVGVKGIVLGKKFELNDLSFDLNNPVASAQEIIEKVSELFA